MNGIKIAFFDIDGTLVSNTMDQKLPMEKRIPISTKKAIVLLKATGVLPVIATGRGKAMITDVLNELEIDTYITSNGQSVIHKGSTIFNRFLEKEQVADIISVLEKKEDVIYGYDTPDGRFVVTDNMSTLPKAQQHHIQGTKEDYLKYDISQVGVYTKNYRNFVFDVPGVKAKVVAPNVLNILPSDVSKASGLEILLRHLKLEKSNAVAFGDEENDAEMFEVVGYAVAMGNAIASLKQQASYITDSVDDDGIYNACKYLNLI